MADINFMNPIPAPAIFNFLVIILEEQLAGGCVRGQDRLRGYQGGRQSHQLPGEKSYPASMKKIKVFIRSP